MHLTMIIGKVQRYVVAKLDDLERSVRGRRRQAQNLGQKRRRLALVANPDNRVVEPYGHETP